MQWTLRTMLVVMAGLGCTLAGATAFGIAVTLTSLVISCGACFAYSRLENGRRRRRALFALTGFTLAALYIGTFIAFRVFRDRKSVV